MDEPAPLHRFRLEAFEGIDVVHDEDARQELCAALAAELVSRRQRGTGDEGVPELIAELNALGHAFARREQRDPAWATWLEHTNDGTRHCYIHVEVDDPESVMVLYDETLDAMVARRREGMSVEERARDERAATFYDRGLALTDRYEEYASLPEADRLLLCLYLLDTGVANGGFGTYVTNMEGAHLDDAHVFLEQVGAPTSAAVVREVLDALPPLTGGLTDAVWAALEAKVEALDRLDERFYGADEDLAELTLAYLERR